METLPSPHDSAAPAEGRPSPFELLFAPDRAMERQAKVGRAGRLLLFAWMCSLFLAFAVASRVDAASATLRDLDASGQLKGMSDRQVAEETHNAERVFQVVTVARGVVGAPLQLGLGCAAIAALTWFFRGRIKGSAVAPVAAAALLPEALASLADAASALRHQTLPPEAAAFTPRTLTALLALAGHPLGVPWLKLGNAFDLFSLWAAVMMGFGVAAAGKVPRRAALAGTLVGWVCWRLVTQVAMGG